MCCRNVVLNTVFNLNIQLQLDTSMHYNRKHVALANLLARYAAGCYSNYKQEACRLASKLPRSGGGAASGITADGLK